MPPSKQEQNVFLVYYKKKTSDCSVAVKSANQNESTDELREFLNEYFN